MPSAEELRALWLAGDWHTLLPFMRVAARDRAWPVIRNTTWGNDDVLNDIVQDAMIRCWRCREVPDDPLAFAALVAKNRALDLHKRGSHKYETREPEHGDPADNPAVLVADSLDALSVIVEGEDAATLRAAVNALPDVFRRPLVSHYFEGRPTEALAREFGIGTGAVRLRLVRARRALAALLRSTPGTP